MDPTPRVRTAQRAPGIALAVTGLSTLFTVFWLPLNDLPYAPTWWDFAFAPHFSRIVTISCWLLAASGAAGVATGVATVIRPGPTLNRMTYAVALLTLFTMVLSAGGFMVMMDGAEEIWLHGGIGYFAVAPLWLGALAAIVMSFTATSDE